MRLSCCGDCRCKPPGKIKLPPGVKVLFPFIAYGIPVVSLFAGVILGSFISETAAIGLGLFFLAVGFAASVLISRQIYGKPVNSPHPLMVNDK